MSTAAQSVPSIDRAMELLGILERAHKSVGTRDLLGLTGIPRATGYRLLKALTSHGLVRLDRNNEYSLGFRLLSLAAAVPGGEIVHEIAVKLDDELRLLSARTGETAKLSVRSGLLAVVVASVHGANEGALVGAIGRSYPLHSGASGRILLAYADKEVRKKVLGGELKSYSAETITSVPKLEQSISGIHKLGYAHDTGEYTPGISALAVPLFQDDKMVATLSTPYLSGGSTEVRSDLLAEVCDAGQRMSKVLSR